jgi:hypothetical protein
MLELQWLFDHWFSSGDFFSFLRTQKGTTGQPASLLFLE